DHGIGPGVVEDLPELGEAPSQRAARVVGHVPEHLADALPALRLTGHGKVGEQRTRLARSRQAELLAVAKHGELAHHPNFQGSVGLRAGRRHPAITSSAGRAAPMLSGRARALYAKARRRREPPQTHILSRFAPSL